MGREAQCRVRLGRASATGKAKLESDMLSFRGGMRLDIPFRDMKAVATREGVLSVTWPGGTARFELGAQADAWSEKIRNPKGLIDKLGVRAGMRVAVLGVDDDDFLRDLEVRTEHVSRTRPRGAVEMIFLCATSARDLAKLAGLVVRIPADGAIWVVWPKGRRELKEDDVRAEALRSGLVDVKVASFSPTHSALKLVVRVARRR